MLQRLDFIVKALGEFLKGKVHEQLHQMCISLGHPGFVIA